MIRIVDLPAITMHPVFLGFVFILFVLTIKKMKKIVFNALWIALASVLFPIAMNRLLGFSVPVDANSIIFYLTIGLGAYFLYLFARAVHTTLGIAEKIASPLARKIKGSQTQKREKKIDKLIKDREEKEREGERLKNIAKRTEKKKSEEEDRLQKIMKKAEKQKRSPEEEYFVLKDEEDEKEQEKKSKNIISKFREAED